MSTDLVAQLLLMDRMPITYNALVVEYTTRCNARCGMCYQAAGPKGSDILGAAVLEEKEIARVISEAALIETVEPRFHITGGEAFLRTDLLLRLISVARDHGFVQCTTTTNGTWATKPGVAAATARRARAAGMTGIEISWDAWHLPYVSAEAVGHCVEACFDAGIDVHLRLLSARSSSFQAALELLPLEALRCAERISGSPVFPTGRAATELPRSEWLPSGALTDTCHSSLNLTVNARGDVSPCCAGLDQLSEHRFANIRESSLGEIVASFDASPILRSLVFRGVTSIRELVESEGVPVGDDYTGICHMCWSIFSEPRRVQALESALQRIRRESLEQAILRLQARDVR